MLDLIPSTFYLLSGLILAGFSVYLFASVLVGNNSDADQLAWASGDEPAKSDSPLVNASRPLVHNFTLQHAAKIKNPRYRANVEKKIVTAGLSKELNVDEFIGLKILWGIVGPLVIFVLDFALQFGFGPVVIFGLGALGFFGPDLYCKNKKAQRYLSVVNDLPFYVDLLALSTKAGLSLMNAIQRIVEKSEKSVLSDELSIVMKDIKLGSSKTDALRGLAERLDIPEITSFVSVVIDSEATGASVFDVLQEQSNQMRMERFVRAEKAGAKASQTILIPMMIFILPAVFIAVFAPMAIQFFSGGN